jgi:hypothetical protein
MLAEVSAVDPSTGAVMVELTPAPVIVIFSDRSVSPDESDACALPVTVAEPAATGDSIVKFEITGAGGALLLLQPTAASRPRAIRVFFMGDLSGGVRTRQRREQAAVAYATHVPRVGTARPRDPRPKWDAE